jgi:PKD repeat protein
MLVIFFCGSLSTVSANQAPVANAGSNHNRNVGQIVNFNGGGSWDPDNDTLTYKWYFADGNNSGWLNSSTTSHIYTVAGNYHVNLTVSDGTLFSWDYCWAFISAPGANQAPVANAGSNQTVIVNALVNFNGNNSYDPDSDPITYFWNYGDGNISGWQNWSTSSHTYVSLGTYYVTLSVSDGSLIDNDTCTINVNPSNYPPVPNAGSDKYAKMNETVYFSGNGSYDPDNDPLTYMWYFGDSTYSSWSSSYTASHKYNATGTFNAYLGAKDSQYTIYDHCFVYISSSGSNQAPIANAGSDQNGNVGSPVYFNGGGSYDPDSDPLLYRWDFGDGYISGWYNYSTISHSYNNAGNYTVVLKVNDGQLNDTDSCIAHITIGGSNQAPVANAGSDQNTKINLTVYFDGSGSYDPDNDPLLYKWDFGDSFSTGWQYNSNATHIYYVTGNFSATLYVKDSNFTDSDSCIIHVTSNWNPAPKPTDTDGDGYIDDEDDFPYDPTQWLDTDGDGYGDNKDGTKPDLFPNDPDEWGDTDGDGYGDNEDEFPDDPDEWVDTDGDGKGDNGDEFPSDPDEWEDTDGDGKGDNGDDFPEDPTEWSDQDQDGHGDFSDVFPTDPNEWIDTDSDAIGDNADMFPDDHTEWLDTDLDGVGDNSDMFPQEPTQWEDKDGDGHGDNPDGKYPDEFPDDPTEWRDTDGDTVGDNADAYPNDSSRSVIEPSKESGGTEDYTYIAVIILLLIVIVILTTILIFNKKKNPIRPYHDERRVNDNLESNVISTYDDFETAEISDNGTDEYILELTDEALALQKPSDFKVSEQDMLAKIEQKYRKGEISTETYNQIQNKLA